jgi:hypothetical protein
MTCTCFTARKNYVIAAVVHSYRQPSAKLCPGYADTDRMRIGTMPSFLQSIAARPACRGQPGAQQLPERSKGSETSACTAGRGRPHRDPTEFEGSADGQCYLPVWRLAPEGALPRSPRKVNGGNGGNAANLVFLRDRPRHVVKTDSTDVSARLFPAVSLYRGATGVGLALTASAPMIDA